VELAKVDVQDGATVKACFDAVIAKHGAIDVLVNNAGYGAMGVFEGISEESYKRQFDVNVFGVMRTTQAVLPHMRKAKKGTIVQISSCVGQTAFGYGAPYVASKWALEGFSESLQSEVAPFGIQIKLVEPGAFKTDFVGRSADISGPPAGAEEYAPGFEFFNGFIGSLMAKAEGPELVATATLEAATNTELGKMRFPIFWDGDANQQMYNLRQTSTDPDAVIKANLAMMAGAAGGAEGEKKKE
jgi:NAD(P)-dependent dehydrogenase (short-subunit alcohol dehydrogenase family)